MKVLLSFATGNPHKFKEAKHYLEHSINGLHLKQCRGNFPEIQASDLEPVARFKIKKAIEICGGNVFMEDAGLFIPKLRGFPGVYSAYIKKTLDCKGILKLMEDYQDKGDRAAYFKACTCIYLEKTGETHLFTGRIEGHLSFEERGSNGFGFDPIFISSEPPGNEMTFGEMKPEEKVKISHRTKALKELQIYLSTVFG